MSRRGDFELICDIKEAVKRIEDYIIGLTFIKFLDDVKTQDAITRNLEIIGEAVKNIPSDVKDKHPDVEWKKIAGLRDILAHEYFGIDIEILWDIVENKLPDLKKEISRLLKK